ncbi:MAG: divalent metal cation transporter, partial [candidate division NC10 bacterium]|nr:divalent metal cation transporter [candidate division NC10 bacterium]
AIVQEMGTRMGVMTGKGLADLVRERFGVRITLGVMGILVLANLANTASEFAGVAASLEIFGVSRYLSVPLAVALVSWLVVKGTYRIVERIFLGASLFYTVYIISAFLAHPPWPEIARQTIQPTVRLERDYLLMLITLVGTTIAPWMQFYLQSSIVDKGVRVKQYRYARLDAIFGSLVATAVAFFIIVSCGATLYAHGVRVETAGQAAMAIRPFAGRYASLLFALGLLNASIFSAAIVPLSTAYAVCESLGWETGVDRSLKEAPSFFAIYLGMVAVGAALTLWPKAPLLKIMVLSQTLNGILLPLVLFLMLKLINDRDVMGPYVNSRWTNVLAWGTALVLILLPLVLLFMSLIS